MDVAVISSKRDICYKVYVLGLLLFAYLLNQLDRYMLSVVTKSMAQSIHYGDMVCMKNSSTSGAAPNCSSHETELSCEAPGAECDWNYNGQGLEYQILAGPVFIVVYTLAGIPLGLWADVYNRKTLLGAAVFLWSLMTTLTGLVKEYWQLTILRFLLGISEAGCTPFAASLIADYFISGQRALAMGVYNWGIYFGYSLAYAVGNFITQANILNQGWRWAYYLSGIPGLVLGPIIIFTLREPQRQLKEDGADASDVTTLLGHHEDEITCCSKARIICKAILRPSVLLLFLAGSIRNAAGYIWAYNTQPYFETVGQTPEQIGKYMSWIPLVGGSIGVVLGGFISDRVVKKIGPHARLLVLVISQVLAAPFVAGALYLDPPYAFLSLIPGNIIGEMWVGIALAVLVELLPSPLRTVGVAVYLFVISNVGGNLPLLVPPLEQGFINLGYSKVAALRGALYILYPGLYVLGAVFFLVTMLVLKRDLSSMQRAEYEPLR